MNETTINIPEEKPKEVTLQSLMGDFMAIQKSFREERLKNPRTKSPKCKRERAKKNRR